MSVHHYNDLQNAVAAKDARIAYLEDELRIIVDVASGEQQIGEDDTGGMAWIDKRARTALSPATSQKDKP